MSLVYSLGQTLVFARALDRMDFSATIAAMTIGFYLLPLNQAVARANFHLVRRSVVDGRGEAGHGEAAAAFHVSQALMVLAGVAGPLLLFHGDWRFYSALAAVTVASNLTNFWYFEVQTTILAVERSVPFEVATVARRLGSFAALGLLWKTHDFLIFGVNLLAIALMSQIWVIRDVARRSDLFDIPRRLAWREVKVHLVLLWSSLLATFAEWASLNGPYALFMIRFGVGSALIVLDTGMKLLRIVLTVVRNLSEIALPRVSSAVLRGAAGEARRFVALILAVSALPAIAIAGALLLNGQLIWRALLGANNVMPNGVGAPFALAIIASVGFQAGSHLVGHVGRLAEIRTFMVTACLGVLVGGAYVLLARPGLLASVWVVAGSFVFASAAGLWAIGRVLFPTPQPLASG